MLNRNLPLQTEKILVAQMSANSRQLEQPYTSAFPELRQSYLQLTFPRITPIPGLGYDIFSKISLTKGNLSEEGESI